MRARRAFGQGRVQGAEMSADGRSWERRGLAPGFRSPSADEGDELSCAGVGLTSAAVRGKMPCRECPAVYPAFICWVCRWQPYIQWLAPGSELWQSLGYLSRMSSPTSMCDCALRPRASGMKCLSGRASGAIPGHLLTVLSSSSTAASAPHHSCDRMPRGNPGHFVMSKPSPAPPGIP